MGKKKGKKLSVKKQTVRKLDALSPDQLQEAAGGTELGIKAGAIQNGGYEWIGGGNYGASWVGPRPPGSFGCTTV